MRSSSTFFSDRKYSFDFQVQRDSGTGAKRIFGGPLTAASDPVAPCLVPETHLKPFRGTVSEKPQA